MHEFFTENQKKDIAFFEENFEKWLSDPLYKQKFVVISGQELKVFFDSFEVALKFAVFSVRGGDYVIQQILPKDEMVNFPSPDFVVA